MNTTEGQNLRTMFTTGNMKNHIYEFKTEHFMAGVGSASVGFSKNGKYTSFDKITGADINGLQLWFRATIARVDIDKARGAETFGHEAFIHNELKITAINRVLSNTNLTNDMKAEVLKYINRVSEFRENDKVLTIGGQFDHAKFLKGEKKTYNSYIKQLLGNLSETERIEVLKEIESYAKDLINVGNENVIRYTGKEAQDLWRELQKQFQ